MDTESYLLLISSKCSENILQLRKKSVSRVQIGRVHLSPKLTIKNLFNFMFQVKFDSFFFFFAKI